MSFFPVQALEIGRLTHSCCEREAYGRRAAVELEEVRSIFCVAWSDGLDQKPSSVLFCGLALLLLGSDGTASS